MSVESEILRIQHNIADSYAKVAEKGGTVPLQPNSRNLAAAIDSIPQTLPPPDNNPIGTVISFMGTAAPKDYLICDGAEYRLSEYPALAEFFRQQFGAANHFGGDGTDTFAVPDMRNLFLRGFHGEAEEALSGEVGERQEATKIPYFFSAQTGSGKFIYNVATKEPSVGNFAENPDREWDMNSTYGGTYNSTTGNTPYPEKISVRPVNMAVLYCIKAEEAKSGWAGSRNEIYFMEETRIGTWIDGKPLYRKVYNGISGNNDLSITVGEIENLDKAVDMYGFIFHNSISGTIAIPDINVEPQAVGSAIKLYAGNAVVRNQPFTLVVEYTKITDGME